MVPHRPRVFIEQGRRIAAARDDRGQRDGRTFTQKDLAQALHDHGYGRSVPRQSLISDIERGYVDVPKAMRPLLLHLLPDLVLDSVDEDEDDRLAHAS